MTMIEPSTTTPLSSKLLKDEITELETAYKAMTTLEAVLSKRFTDTQYSEAKAALKAALSKRPPPCTEGFFLSASERKKLFSNIQEVNGCQLWEGEGKVKIHGKRVAPKYLLWFLENGPVPKGFSVKRNCTTERCVSPACSTLVPTKQVLAGRKPTVSQIPEMPESRVGNFVANIRKTDTCWVWTGRTNPFGYGLFRIHGKDYQAHRVAYQIFHSYVPASKVVMHKCDAPFCVNPDHLTLGTNEDNHKDSREKGRKMGDFRRRELWFLPGEKKEARLFLKLGVKPKVLSQKYGVNVESIERLRNF